VIDAEKANYPIAWMCRLLGVPRSSFYAWRRQAAIESATQARRGHLSEHVMRVFTDGRGAYGCRRVAAQLNSEGHACSVGLVADLMRELRLAGCQPRAYKRTTIPGEQPVSSPDLIERDFTTDGVPGQRLVGDITYLRTGQGWLYLATVIDLATRMVVGWQITEHMRTALVLDALAWLSLVGMSARGRCFTPTAARSTPRASFPSTASRMRFAPALVGPGCVGTTLPRVVLRVVEERDVPPRAVPDPCPGPVRRR